MRKFLIVAVCTLLTACSHSLIISDSSETAASPPKGNVKPLHESLAGSEHIYLVMIHGVGDHCPGYALGEMGWLSKHASSRIGLRRATETAVESIDIFDDEFIQGKERDPHSKVTYRKAEYVYTSTNTRLTAIEITWSQLTQWKKSQQLGYDTAGTNKAHADGDSDCMYSTIPGDQTVDSSPPPSRVILNRIIKEKTFNRNLVDAIFYVGEYGRTIQRGIAEAFCRSIGGSAHVAQGTGQPDGQLCLWPDADNAVPDEARFVFVTHSLGSRALYDVLLGLTGDRVNEQKEIFSAEMEVERSRDIVCRIIGRTAAVYMMANQLPLLGLAYDSGKNTTSDGPQPYDSYEYLPVRGCGPRTPATVETAQNSNVDTDSLPATAAFTHVWKRAREIEGQHEGMLTIVAFHDTNDLLSWGIPKWYTTQKTGNTLPVTVTNVYVKNGTRWFGTVVNPADAHSGYFDNPEVWSVVVCGAHDGKLGNCDSR